MKTFIRPGELAAWHVVVLMFAGWLLSVPVSQGLRESLPPGSVGRELIGRALPYVIIGAAILLVTPLRRVARERFAPSLPGNASSEVGIALSLDVLSGFAWMGAYVLWWHLLEGPVALEQRLDFGTHAQALARALSIDGLLFSLLMAVVLGPIIEELIFRAILFPLWERQYGWTVSVFLTSVLFGLYHTNFMPAFVSSLLLTSLYSRTRSLKVVIIAHSAHNLLVYYPLLGRFIAPHDLSAPGDLRAWGLHVMVLSVCMVAIPLYVWIAGLDARERKSAEGHVPVSC